MQTLVYENYNKFISATDTIRKVRELFVFQLPVDEQNWKNRPRTNYFDH